MNRRAVATGLLIALLAVFGMATPATADAGSAQPHAMATTAAQTLPMPHSTPELPLAETEAAAATPAPPRPAEATHPADAPPRAHRQPAADRAPPAT